MFESLLQTSYFALFLIISLGFILGRIKIKGLSLDVSAVIFIALLFGHFGVTIPKALGDIGLVLFIFTIGIQAGPGFFDSFRSKGKTLIILALLIVGSASITGIIFKYALGIDTPSIVGLIAGALTSTPGLAVAIDTTQSSSASIAYGIAYPFGVIGVILSVIVLKAVFGKKYSRGVQKDESLENTFVAEYHVSNPAVFGHSIKEIMPLSGRKFVISRVWKDGKVIIPASDTVIDEDDHLLIISGKHDVDAIRTLFGDRENIDWNKKDIDWNSIDSELVSRHVLVTKPNLNGVKLGSLKLRNSYGINITRVNRAGIDLLASPSLRLQLGDKLTIVGETKAIDNVATILGNQEKQLRNPNLFAIFIGLAIGLVIGSIPFTIPGMSMPVKLGLAGGPIITGILMGAFGPRLHLSIYTTRSANLMLRQLGLIIYLAGLGLSAGKDFFETVFRTEGLVWIGVSFLLAVAPVLIVGWIATRWAGVDYAGNVGMLCGSMANPIALDYANTTVDGDEPSVAYATVYPFSIFLRVISIQIILLVFS